MIITQKLEAVVTPKSYWRIWRDIDERMDVVIVAHVDMEEMALTFPYLYLQSSMTSTQVFFSAFIHNQVQEVWTGFLPSSSSITNPHG